MPILLSLSGVEVLNNYVRGAPPPNLYLINLVRDQHPSPSPGTQFACVRMCCSVLSPNDINDFFSPDMSARPSEPHHHHHHSVSSCVYLFVSVWHLLNTTANSGATCSRASVCIRVLSTHTQTHITKTRHAQKRTACTRRARTIYPARRHVHIFVLITVQLPLSAALSALGKSGIAAGDTPTAPTTPTTPTHRYLDDGGGWIGAFVCLFSHFAQQFIITQRIHIM